MSGCSGSSGSKGAAKKASGGETESTQKVVSFSEQENDVMSKVLSINLDASEFDQDFSTLVDPKNPQQYNGYRDPGVAAYKDFQNRQDEDILKKTGLTSEEYMKTRQLLQANGTITGNLRDGTFDSKGNLVKPTGLQSWDDDLRKLGKNIGKLDNIYKKAVLDKDIVTFRGINGDPSTLQKIGLTGDPKTWIGKKIEDKGYACQTTSIAVARGYIENDKKVLIVNKIKAGQRALSWDTGSNYGGIGSNEQITPDRGSKFIIKSVVKKGKYTIIQTETEQE